MFDLKFALYAMPFAAVVSTYVLLRWRGEAKSRAVHNANLTAGLVEPSSLHPLIDPALCIGCSECTKVCPEGKILGVYDGKAHLIEPTSCIGHGACKTACPTDAISLVFGTATRGVDIPYLSPSFETNVPGIFVAGELGGMGLIANAIEQGHQAIRSIARLSGLRRNDRYDVVIVGSGPAGISAGLAAQEAGLSYVMLEQESFGGTVAHYPKGKLIMTRPAMLPREGEMMFREVRKEVLLEYLYDLWRKYRFNIYDGERVERIVPDAGPHNDSFQVITAKNSSYLTRSVLLAIGRRGSPKRLCVPGEELPKVVYRLSDPAQYHGKQVLIVGGGDSALEAAADLAEHGGVAVTLSYRGSVFNNAKPRSRQRLERAVRANEVTLLLQSNVSAIGPQSVEINVNGTVQRYWNDAVVICAGGTMPTALLNSTGIDVETKYGTP